MDFPQALKIDGKDDPVEYVDEDKYQTLRRVRLSFLWSPFEKFRIYYPLKPPQIYSLVKAYRMGTIMCYKV